jgi:hypothetical protein
VQGVGQLADEELIDLIRVAIGEARRRNIRSVSQVGESSQRTAPVVERTTPMAGRITRKSLPGFRVGDRLVVMRYAEITPESRKSRNAWPTPPLFAVQRVRLSAPAQQVDAGVKKLTERT